LLFSDDFFLNSILMKIKSIIVDDEPNVRQTFQSLIDQFYSEDIEILASLANVKDAVRAINSLKPELVFLDIEMPKENGLQLFEYFGDNYDFEVVFTTDNQQYTLQTFKYTVLDCLNKPFDHKMLGESIQRYKRI
jgi:two-component system, LytTR family, response regulator